MKQKLKDETYKSLRTNTKWFSYERAKLVQQELFKKGISTELIKTSKINSLDGKKKSAYLVKKLEKGHIKHFIGDDGRLGVEMRKPNKVFIVRSWYWDVPTKMKVVCNKHFKTRKEAEDFYKRIVRAF